MSAVQVRRWTREEYDRVIEAGVLTPEDHVELIDGEILAITPQGSAHATAVSLAQEALRSAVGEHGYVRARLPLALGSESEPEPDVAVVAGSARDYRDAHPGSAMLVAEIADATLAHDRDVKKSLYARARIPEYWIVNLIERHVEICREPLPMPGARFGWGYRTVERRGPGDSILPASLPGVSIAIADLLP
jgi:Uma2 family endonuclease